MDRSTQSASWAKVLLVALLLLLPTFSVGDTTTFQPLGTPTTIKSEKGVHP